MKKVDFSQLLEKILSEVRDRKMPVKEALRKLKHFPFDACSFARIDIQRGMRQGFPEVVLCEGKTREQSVEILGRLAKKHPVVLATRANRKIFLAVRRKHRQVKFNESGRTIRIGKISRTSGGRVLVVCAGTSDMPVAEEARETAAAFGVSVDTLYDVGVSGIHRLFSGMEKLEKADVLVVAAGMEGALPSVVGGLVDKPVIAVPTSVGYGASFRGLAALLAMLNSCAANVSVVNIDNGFGAGFTAGLIARNAEKSKRRR